MRTACLFVVYVLTNVRSGYNWTIILPAELSAAAVLINYWNQSVNNAVWITMCLVVVITINMFGAGVYGECEFIFAYVIASPSFLQRLSDLFL